jgi:plasmid stabilization system protein ParE
MAYTLVIKKRFQNKLLKVLEYLEEEWNMDVASKFVLTVEKRLSGLLTTPFSGAATGFKGVRSIFLTKQNRIYYKVSGSQIIILNMYDTRINPERNPYNKR